LARAAGGCAKALRAASGQEQASQIARFHCSNFMRLMKEAPALSLDVANTGLGQEDFLPRVLQAIGPEMRQGVSQALLEKIVTSSLERWTACYKPGSQGPSDEVVDGLAMLVASSFPGACPKLLAWTVSEDSNFYCLALRIHQMLPLRMGAERSLSWAQLLLDGLLLVRGEAEAGRADCQTASCITVLLAACPPECVGPWVQRALSPLLVRCKSSSALWTLARRLCRALSGPARAGLAEVANAAEDVLRPETYAACGLLGYMQRLRCLAELVQSGYFEQEKLKAISGELQVLLASERVPVRVRTEVWAVHAECCLRRGEVADAAADFRVSVRYAIKHLASVDAAGARVASALSRVPGAHLTGSGTAAIKGLCSMDWPLRAAGLSAAAAATARRNVQADVQDVARSAILAFEEEHGYVISNDCKSGWMAEQAPAVAHQRKRRRLLENLASLPDALPSGEEVADELPELCAVVRAKIDVWLSA